MKRILFGVLFGTAVTLIGLTAGYPVESNAQVVEIPTLDAQPLGLNFNTENPILQITSGLGGLPLSPPISDLVQESLQFLGVIIDRAQVDRGYTVFEIINTHTGYLFARKKVKWTKPVLTFEWPFILGTEVRLRADIQTVEIKDAKSGKLLASCKKKNEYPGVRTCSEANAGHDVPCGDGFPNCVEEPRCECIDLGEHRDPKIRYMVQATCCPKEDLKLTAKLPTIIFLN